MPRPITPELAQRVVNLRGTHPKASAFELLDLVLTGPTGSLADFGNTVEPATPFGFIIAEAFDGAMHPQDWRLATNPASPPSLVAALRGIWANDVLPKLAGRYGLTS